jgi:hypothetical protein
MNGQTLTTLSARAMASMMAGMLPTVPTLTLSLRSKYSVQVRQLMTGTPLRFESAQLVQNRGALAAELHAVGVEEQSGRPRLGSLE